MASLNARTAFDGRLPVAHGDAELRETAFDAITWIAPHDGRHADVSAALERQIGGALPDPNRCTGRPPARAVWAGPGQALILGPPLKPIAGAAMVDQTAAWASCLLEGPDAAAVLARLVPIDLRDGAFATDHAARTVLGHMNCVLMRTGLSAFGIMVFRSMAGTCAHELDRAMRMVAARRAR